MNLGISCLPVRPYSDAGCANLPLTVLGAPVSIGETGVTAKTEILGAALPGQDHMRPFGIIGVATRYMMMMMS
jgi:hypothetical protein